MIGRRPKFNTGVDGDYPSTDSVVSRVPEFCARRGRRAIARQSGSARVSSVGPYADVLGGGGAGGGGEILLFPPAGKATGRTLEKCKTQLWAVLLIVASTAEDGQRF